MERQLSKLQLERVENHRSIYLFLDFVEEEIKLENIPVSEAEEVKLCHAPRHKEETEMETFMEKLEHDLREVKVSLIDLKRTYQEATELRYILLKTQQFYDEVRRKKRLKNCRM